MTASKMENGQITGDPGRTRTADTWFRKPLLYPLSYGAIHRHLADAGIVTQCCWSVLGGLANHLSVTTVAPDFESVLELATKQKGHGPSGHEQCVLSNLHEVTPAL